MKKIKRGSKKVKIQYNLGGDILKGVGDIGLTALGMGNVIPDNAYGNVKIGKIASAMGNVGKAVLPIAANIVAPGVGGAVTKGLQMAGNQFNPETQQYFTPEQVQQSQFPHGGYLGASITNSIPNPLPTNNLQPVMVQDPNLQAQLKPVPPVQPVQPTGWVDYYGVWHPGKKPLPTHLQAPTGNINTYTGVKAYGGKLTRYENGGTHESNMNGGIPVGTQSLVEEGETRMQDYIFSDRLKPKGSRMSYASHSKKIENGYKNTNDPMRLEAKEKNLGILMNNQEIMRSKMSRSKMMKYGGKMRYPIGGELNLQTGTPEQDINNYYNSLPDSLPYSPESMIVMNYALNSDVVPPTSLPRKDINQIQTGKLTPDTLPLNTNTPPTGSFSNLEEPQKALKGKLPYWAMGAQALGPLSELMYGLKGPDPVNFQRVNPELMNPAQAKLSADIGIQRSYNSANQSLRNNNLTSGQYRTNRLMSAGSESLNRGQTAANIQSQYDNANTGIKNQAGQFNAQVQMQESIARQQEKDAARTHVTQGLDRLGNRVAGASKDISMNNVQNMILEGLKTGEYMIDQSGQVVKIRKYGGRLKLKNC